MTRSSRAEDEPSTGERTKCCREQVGSLRQGGLPRPTVRDADIGGDREASGNRRRRLPRILNQSSQCTLLVYDSLIAGFDCEKVCRSVTVLETCRFRNRWP